MNDDFFGGSALDRELKIAYAANWEDIRLQRVTSLLRSRTYIDVGAGDPVVGSVTYLLYLRGWRGILIEPGTRYSELARVRPEDVAVRAGIGSSRGELTLYETYPDSGMSTFDPERLARLAELGQSWQEVTVPVVPLDDLIRDHLDEPAVGILSIDVEGWEADVLRSIDLATCRPEVIIVEATEPWTRVPTHDRFEPILLDVDYAMAVFDGINRFYVDTRHPFAGEILELLGYPISALDRFTTLEAESARKVIAERDAAIAELDSRMRLAIQERDAIVSSRTWRVAARISHALRRVPGLRRMAGKTKAAALSARPMAAGALRRVPPALMPGRLRRRLAAGSLRIHPAFLSGPSSPTLRTSKDWDALAAQVRRDTDDELLHRLKSREGVRPSLHRQVQLAALAHRVRNEGKPAGETSDRHLVLVDGRSLQNAGLLTRGIGRYAAEVLKAASRSCQADEVLLFVDPSAPRVPAELGHFRQVTELPRRIRRTISHVIEPSPMTSDLWPLAALLADAEVQTAAIVYDFIPWRFPACYLPGADDRLVYESRLAALSLFDDVWSISATTLTDFAALVGPPNGVLRIVWPSTSQPDQAPPRGRVSSGGYILIETGQEHRKNLYAALEACVIASQGGDECELVVCGWGGPPGEVLRLAALAGAHPESVTVLPWLADEALAEVRSQAELVLVSSFAEGLSLPVIQAMEAGVPVVASDIPVHRELITDGPWLAKPVEPTDFARAIEHVRHHRSATHQRQHDAFSTHAHSNLTDVTEAWLNQRQQPRAQGSSRREPKSLAIVSPWPPQKSGVADYSETTLSGLDGLVPTAFYATSSAAVKADRQLLDPANPGIGAHDHLLTVIGNSHFHIPGLEVIELYGGTALCHDVRLVELNSYLGISEDRDGISDESTARTSRHELDSLRSLGFEHLAKHCDLLLFHSPRTAERVAEQTGARTAALPFVPHRHPSGEDLKAIATRRRHPDSDSLRVGLFGGVDVRTKAADVVVEAVAWLQEWGVPATLEIVGEAGGRVERSPISSLIRAADLEGKVHWHGRVAEPAYRSLLCSIDVGVQIRNAELLTLSGAAADFAAFGLPAVVTAPMFHEMSLPDFIGTVPADFSPLLLAEVILHTAQRYDPGPAMEARAAYMAAHSIDTYQAALLSLLGLAAS